MEAKADICIVEIQACDLPYPHEAVKHGVSMDVEHSGRFLRTTIGIEERLQRPD